MTKENHDPEPEDFMDVWKRHEERMMEEDDGDAQ
jgi:hypothetical protein